MKKKKSAGVDGRDSVINMNAFTFVYYAFTQNFSH